MFETRQTAELIQIAAAAKSGGATIYMRGPGTRRTAELVQIAAAGAGHVIFADKLPDLK